MADKKDYLKESIRPDIKDDKDILIIAKAKMRLADFERKSRELKSEKDPYLYVALNSCLEAELRLPKEIEQIDLAIKELQESAPLDPTTKIRTDYLEYRKEELSYLVKRSAQAARDRLEHLEEINSPAKIRIEKEKCSEDIHYWFKWYAWTADPRNSLLWAIPFIPFEYQTNMIDWLQKLIFRLKTNGLNDKSRDMGATWTIICFMAKQWLFPNNGTAFQALVGSIKSSDVDEVGNPSTILEKLRIQLKLTPHWMLPNGWKGTFPEMKCINPENGSAITGETANQDFGRSGRYTMIWFDEFAAFELAEAADTASSQSTYSRIYTFTPKGAANHAAYLRLNSNISVLTLHWKLHPLKDERWYKYQKLTMNAVQVAQELDIDYYASQAGRVYEEYSEVHHVITKSEFMKAFPQSRDGNGKFRLPPNCYVGMGQDWGSTEGHPNVSLWFMVMKQGSVTTNGIDLTGSVFLFHEHLAEVNTTVRKVAESIKAFEKSVGLTDEFLTDRLMSHEAKSERDTYSQEHQLSFKAWSTDYNAGVAQVKDFLELHSFHQPHPFREITRLEDFEDCPKIMGRPRFFIIVEDKQGQLNYDYAMNRWYSSVAKDNEGMRRTRTEFPIYHYPSEEIGKPTKRLRPVKKMDDAMDVVRCVGNTFFPPIHSLTKFERMESSIPESLRIQTALAATPEEQSRIYLARMDTIAQFEKKEKITNVPSWRDAVYEKARNKSIR